MKILLLISLSLFLLLATAATALAADSFTFDQDNFFLQTSGQNKVLETVLIKNQTEKPITVDLSWEVFPESKHSIDFVSLSTRELEIQPFAVGAVEVSFMTPATLASGDYYGSLLAKNAAEVKKSAFTLRFLGSLTQQIHLQSVGHKNNRLELLFENQGNIRSPVSGKVVITSFFGQRVSSFEIAAFEIKASEKVLKSFPINNLLPGPYQAKVELSIGEKKINQSSVSSFWVSTVLFVILLGLLVVSLVCLAIFLWRKFHV